MKDEKYYDDNWKKEGINTWRVYPGTFGRIAFFVGTGKKVLDVGCGVGVLLNQLKHNGNDCMGVDISKTAIRKMRNTFNIVGECASAPPLPFKKEQFDFVIATEFFEHVDDEQQLIKECYRVCKTGGSIIIAVPNDTLPPSKEPEHVRTYTKKALQDLLLMGVDDETANVFVEEYVEHFQPPGWKDTITGFPMTITLPTLLGRVVKR